MSEKLTEKELLVLKGNALRMRFKAETNKAKSKIIQPLKQVKNTGLSLVTSPVVRSVALNFMLKRFFTIKGMGYSVLGLATLCLLKQKNK